jgi:SAM-dependent methyltransferase
MTTAINDEWYKDFFKGINCEIWENVIPEETTLQEVDFLLSELHLAAGAKILDMPCGFGRHAIPFASLGYRVTGIDISETFITSLNERVKAAKLHVHAICADILNVESPQSFSGALCLGNSFGYFNREKMNVFVQKIANSLLPGGYFIINSGMVAESILPNLLQYGQHNVYKVGNITMEVNNTYCVEDSYLVSNLQYTKGDIKENHSFKHFVFTLGEIKNLLQRCSLRTVATYSGVDKAPYTFGDRQVYIVAIKQRFG